MSNSIVPFATIVGNNCGHLPHYYAQLNVYSFGTAWYQENNQISKKYSDSMLYLSQNQKLIHMIL